MCRSTARFVITRLSAIQPLLRPSAIRPRISSSRGVSFWSTESSPLARGHELLDHSGVDERSACRHVVERTAELGLILEALLEEIRPALRAGVEESHRVPRLGVLAEHDDAHVRMLLPQLRGEADSLVGIRGRHPDIRQDDVRLRALDGGAQLVEVARHLHELDVFDVVEDAHDPLTGEEAVLGCDDADRHPPSLARPEFPCKYGYCSQLVVCTPPCAGVFRGVVCRGRNRWTPHCARRGASDNSWWGWVSREARGQASRGLEGEGDGSSSEGTALRR